MLKLTVRSFSRTPLLARGLATPPPQYGRPSEGATNPVKSGNVKVDNGSSVPTILAAVALGGAAYYYFSSDERAQKAKREFHRAEHKVADIFTSDKGSDHEKTVQNQREALKSEGKTIVDLAKDEVKRDVDALSRRVEGTREEILGKGNEVKSDAKGWFAKTGREAEEEKEKVRAQFEHDKDLIAEGLKNEGKSWFSWGTSQAKSEADELASRTSSTSRDISNTASSTLDSLKSTTRTQAQQMEDSARAAKNALQSTYDDATSKLSSERRAAEDLAREKAEQLKSTSRSWFDWSGKKVDEGKESVQKLGEDAQNRLGGVKEGVKSGLLRVEEEVERGSKKAQEKTRQL